MRVPVRIGNRVVSCLDSTPSPADVAEDFVPATPADAAQAFSPRQVLLLLHAFPLNASMWDAQLASTPPGWRTLAPDMRGCGESGADDPAAVDHVSLDDYAADIIGVLDHLRVQRVVVTGLSMGAYTAFAMLRLAPSRIAGLVLSNTKPDADTEETKRGRLETLTALDREGVAGVLERMLPRLLGSTTRKTRPHVEERVRAIAASNSAGGVRGAIVRLMTRRDSRALLPAVTCPTLVVASDEDLLTPADQAEAMQRSIPGAELHIIREAGHLSNLEQPDQFAAALRRFLTTRFGD